MREYHQDLAMSKFFSGLSPSLRSQMRRQILRENSIPIITTSFSRVVCVNWRWCVICTNYWTVYHDLCTWKRPWFWRTWVLWWRRTWLLVNGVALIKDHVDADIVGGIITSLRSTRRNLVALNRHSWLILTLLPPVILLMLLQPLFLVLLVLPLWYFPRLGMIGCANSSSLRTTIQQLMHPLFRYGRLYCLFIQTLNIRFWSIIPHDLYSKKVWLFVSIK